MKIERGDTYITFEEGDGVAPEHLGRWKLVEGGSCQTCGLNCADNTACREAVGMCRVRADLHYVRT